MNPARRTTTRARRLAVAGAALLMGGVAVLAAPLVSGAAGSGAGVGTGPGGQTLTVAPVTDLDRAGEVVTVTGTGFTAAAGFDLATDGMYLAFCVDNGAAAAPSPCIGGIDMSGAGGASRWITNNPYEGTPAIPIAADGSFTTTIEVAAADDHTSCLALAVGKECKVVTRMDHRSGGDRSQDVKVPVTFADPSATTTTASTTTTTTEAADPAATSTTLTVAPLTVVDGGRVVMTASVATADAARAGAARAAVTAGTVTFLDGTATVGNAALGPDGRATATATVSGVGPHALTASFTGTDAASASTSAPVTVTVTAASDPDPDPDPDPGPGGATPSGTRTGRGVAGQTLTATPVDDLDPAGTPVEVQGRGFTAAAGFDIDEEGLYVSFCVDEGAGTQPTPCVGGVDMEGETGTSAWVTNNPYQGAPSVPIAADGSFTATITVQARDEFVDCLALADGKRCVIVARMDHRATADRSQDVKVPVCFTGEAACAVDPIDPTAATPEGTFTGYPLDPTADAAVSAAGTTPGSLAATGGPLDRTVVAASLLVAGGLVLALAAGRRRAALAVAHRPTPPRPSDPR